MASGFFGVTRPWDLELGFELGADDGVEGVIMDLPVVGLIDPLAQGFVGGQASGLPERMREGGQDVGGQREGCTSWDIPRQQGLQAPRLVETEPVANGLAMDSQQLRHVWACLGLPTRQQIEPVASRFRATWRSRGTRCLRDSPSSIMTGTTLRIACSPHTPIRPSS